MTRYDCFVDTYDQAHMRDTSNGDFVNYWEVKGLLDELKEYLYEIGDCRDRQGNYITDEINKIINKEE